MATTVEGLFNLPTEAQAGQQYYEGLLTSPGQMNNLSLMQQISALGANAGAGIGYAGGRLLGGKAPDEVRIQGVNEAMAEATRMGGTDAEMYSNLAKGLASRGLTQDAMAATERARTAKRDEQAITLAESQEARAVKGEERAVLAEERSVEEAKRRVLADERDQKLFDAEMKGLPNKLKLEELRIREVEKSLRGFAGEQAVYEDALKKGIDPNTGQRFANDAARLEAQARFDEAKNQLKKEADAVAREREKHELTLQSLRANIAQSQAATAASNAKAQVGDFTKAVYSDPDFMNPRGIFVGYANKQGQMIGSNGLPYPNRDDAIRAQLGAPAAIPMPAQAPTQTPTGDNRGLWDRMMNNPQPANAPQVPQKPLSSF
jgi:tetratricopeptide (TPR) repeat protein